MSSPLSPVYRSAACVIPPPHIWPRIQAIRALNDKGYVRWPPHINMLYGFIPDDPLGRNFESAAASLAASLARIKPFWVRLTSLGTFDHGGKSRTLWLHPQPQKGRERAVHELQAAMAAAFPHCNEVGSISPRGFRPHLSVGQWGGHGAAARARAALQASWDKDGPLDFLVDRVCFISRAGFSDPFVLRAEIALGSDSAGAFRMIAPEPALAATVPRRLAPAGAVAEGETAAGTDDSSLPPAGGCGSAAGGGGAGRALSLPAAATGPAGSDMAFVTAPLVLPAAPTTVPGGRAQVGAPKPSHTPMPPLLKPAAAASSDAPAAAVALAAVASVASAVAGAASHGAAAAAPAAAHTAGAGAAAASSKVPAGPPRARPGGPQLMLSPLPTAEGSGGVCGPAPASVAFSEPAPADLEPDTDTSTGMPAAGDAAAAAGASERKGKPKRKGKADAVGGAGAACAGAGGAAASVSEILSEALPTAAGAEPEAADE